jgi:alpha-glucuronidase
MSVQVMKLPSLVYGFREWREKFDFDEFAENTNSKVQVLVSEAFLEFRIDDFQPVAIVVVTRNVAEKSHQKIAASFEV